MHTNLQESVYGQFLSKGEREKNREAKKETERKRPRERDREKETERKRQRGRDRKKDTDKNIHRKERERERLLCFFFKKRIN